MMTDARTRWDARYRESRPEERAPSPFLVTVVERLPPAGARVRTALDVAGGAGRNAVFLARAGFDVTLADVSPVALAAARAAAARAGVVLRLLEHDLERDAPPDGPFDLIVVVDFLHRPLLDTAPALLAPGGLLVMSHPTRSNLARHPHPSTRFLLDDGELPRLVSGLVIEHHSEGWVDDRHVAELVARRP